MLSTIIHGGTAAARADHLRTLVNPQTELIHLQPDSSLGIEQIHDSLARLATTARLHRLIWVESADLLTAPAANALLKILEEPPADTVFYLTCDSASSLLPTIRSRCTVINLPNLPRREAGSANLQIIKQAMAAAAGERLALAASLPTDRSEALAWFTASLHELHDTLSHTSSPRSRLLLSHIARLCYLAHARLKGNVNVNLALGNFLLHLPRTKGVDAHS